MDDKVLRFIQKFQSPATNILFTESACYWFAVILNQRFKNSTIMYNPQTIHFATSIDDILYDITGIIEESSDYEDWDEYELQNIDAPLISSTCILLSS